MTEDLEALVLADALGTLDSDERRMLEEQLAQLSPADHADVARLYDSVLAPLGAELAQVPPAEARARLLRAVAEPARYTVTRSEGWNEAGVPGIQVKVLAVDQPRGQVTLLLRGGPGAKYPAHRHSASEECYVVSGSITIGNLVLRAGDFHHADAGSAHDEITALEDSEVLLVAAIADYLPQ